MKTNKKEAKKLLKVLPIAKYKKLIDELAFYKPILYVTGGEPFLYPGIMELMNYAKKKGFSVTIVTNGVNLKEKAEEIVKNKWDYVLVSLDGPEEIHDKCRNFKGAYKAAYEGLLELQKYKKKYKHQIPFVLTSTTLSQINVNTLDECFNIGKEILPDLMVIYLSWFTNKKRGKIQQKILKSELGVEAFTWKAYVNEFTKEEAKRFQKELINIKKKKWPFDYLIVPDVGEENYAKYYLEPENLFGYSKCAAPFFMVDVMPNGDVVTCRDFVEIKVGNINEKSLLEIWNDRPFVKFRKLLIKHKGTLPQCSRCCGLMGF